MKNVVNICDLIDWEIEREVAGNPAVLPEVEGIWAEVDKKQAEVCTRIAGYSYKSLYKLC